jgi:PAS domain-containing protein
VSEALSLYSFPEAPILEALLDAEQPVLDALPVGIYACDADGRILRVNRKAVLLWGRAPRLLDPVTS